MTAVSLITPIALKAQQSQADSAGVIRVGKELYRLTPGAVDVLIALHQTSGVKVSFFSGGEPERNAEVIQQVYALIEKKVGHTGYRPHLVLSKNHMIEVSNNPELKFHQRFKKDLAKFFDLNSTLLIDDVPGFTPKQQEKNLLWIGRTYNDRPRYELAHLEDPKKRAYSAPADDDQKEWKREQLKLIRILGLVLEARHLALVSRISLVEASQTVLMQEKTGEFDPIRRVLQEKVFNYLRCDAKFH